MSDGRKNRPAKPESDELAHSGAKDGDKDRAAKREATRHKKLDDALELGLEETFPASDPVAIIQPPHSPLDKCEVKRR